MLLSALVQQNNQLLLLPGILENDSLEIEEQRLYVYIYIKGGAERLLAGKQPFSTPAEVIVLWCVIQEPVEKLLSISTVSALCFVQQSLPPQAQSLGLPPCRQTQCKQEGSCGEVCMCYKWA